MFAEMMYPHLNPFEIQLLMDRIEKKKSGEEDKDEVHDILKNILKNKTVKYISVQVARTYKPR